MEDFIVGFLVKTIAYGGGGAVIAFFIFKHLGKSWIENKFSKSLEDFKHKQHVEIQRLRIEIDSTLSGTIKLQEREFETIPEAWRLLDVAYGYVGAFVSPGQEYPNLDQMNEAELEEFLESSELLDSQKAKIRSARNKVDEYIELIFFHHLHKVKVACSKLEIYVSQNGIFFPKNMKENFDTIVEKLHSAFITKAVGQEAKDWKFAHKAYDEVTKEIKPFRKAIEDEIYERLHSHGISTAPGYNENKSTE